MGLETAVAPKFQPDSAITNELSIIGFNVPLGYQSQHGLISGDDRSFLTPPGSAANPDDFSPIFVGIHAQGVVSDC